jgi:hypothetical protein
MFASDTLSRITGADEAGVLHSQNKGRFCIARKHPMMDTDFSVQAKGKSKAFSQSFYTMDLLAQVCQATRSQTDTYISQASFCGQSRRTSMLENISCVYVDLDIYNLGLQVNDQIIQRVLDTASFNGLPLPSYIVNSGRGLYAKWIFERPITATDLPQWKELTSVLLYIYRGLAADSKCSDPSRVFRLLDTVNAKTGSAVEVIYQGAKTYRFEDLLQAAGHVDIERGGFADAAPAELRRVKKSQGVLLQERPTNFGLLASYAAMREPIMLAGKTTRSLNWSRFLDVRDLMMRRGGILTGQRDITAFWMLSFLAHAKIIDSKNFWLEARDLLSAFPLGEDFDPEREGSMSSLIDRIKRADAGEKIMYNGHLHSPIYTPGNDTLINMLEITDGEMQGLRTIISKTEKSRRSDISAPGRNERRAIRTQVSEQIKSAHASATPIKAIAQTAGVSLAWTYRVIAKADKVNKAPQALKAMGPVSSTSQAPQTSQNIQKALAMQQEGQSLKAIAQALQITRQTLWRWIRAHAQHPQNQSNPSPASLTADVTPKQAPDVTFSTDSLYLERSPAVKGVDGGLKEACIEPLMGLIDGVDVTPKKPVDVTFSTLSLYLEGEPGVQGFKGVEKEVMAGLEKGLPSSSRLRRVGRWSQPVVQRGVCPSVKTHAQPIEPIIEPMEPMTAPAEVVDPVARLSNAPTLSARLESLEAGLVAQGYLLGPQPEKEEWLETLAKRKAQVQAHFAKQKLSKIRLI